MHPIEIRGLTKRYGDVVAVDDLSFPVRSGRVTGFLGPNGSGKTTTLRALLGLLEPDAGTATVHGRRYADLPRPAATVGTVLEDAGLVLGENDRASQPAHAPVVNNMVIKVSRVDTAQTAVSTEDIPFEQKKTESAELFKGEEEVTQEGSAGKVEKTYKLVMVDGREASRTLVSETVSVQPVAELVTVGTKPKPVAQAAPAPAGANTGAAAPAMMNEAMWDKIAQCESGGNWSINTGNGYYGGLQFDIQTWLGSGGGAYAPNASLATKAQQIDIANRVYAQRGLQPWGCGWAASS